MSTYFYVARQGFSEKINWLRLTVVLWLADCTHTYYPCGNVCSRSTKVYCVWFSVVVFTCCVFADKAVTWTSRPEERSDPLWGWSPAWLLLVWPARPNFPARSCIYKAKQYCSLLAHIRTYVRMCIHVSWCVLWCRWVACVVSVPSMYVCMYVTLVEKNVHTHTHTHLVYTSANLTVRYIHTLMCCLYRYICIECHNTVQY